MSSPQFIVRVVMRAWRLGCRIRRVIRWGSRGVQGLLLGFLASAIVVCAVATFIRWAAPHVSPYWPFSLLKAPSLGNTGDTGLGIQIVGFFALVLFYRSYQYRSRRILIEEFIGAGADTGKPPVSGLANLLGVQLARLSQLYDDVDEQRAIPSIAGAHRPTEAAIQVDDVGSELKTLSGENKVSIAGVSVPLKPIVSVLEALVQGPRLRATLYEGAGARALTAQMTLGARTFTWRVDDPAPLRPPAQGEGSGRSPSDMVEELACRIFADQALGRTVRWRAVERFSSGLSTYRNCVRTPRDRPNNLKEAERCFIQALSDDEQFSLAYYNLGVVYTELRQSQAAAYAFAQAMKQGPNDWHACYALRAERVRGTEA